MARLLQGYVNYCRPRIYAEIMQGLCTFRKQSPSYMVQFGIPIWKFPSSSAPCKHLGHESLLRRFIGWERSQQGQQFSCITPVIQHSLVLVKVFSIFPSSLACLHNAKLARTFLGSAAALLCLA